MLDNDGFLAKVTDMYKRSREGGAVSVTIKRMTHKVDAKDQSIFRARWRDEKCSTLVPAAKAQHFASSLSDIMIASIDNLKTRPGGTKRKAGHAQVN